MEPYESYLIACAGIFGLILGSFATAVAHRVPSRESLSGRSRCPRCGHTIRAIENIPVLSYLFLRGRCRSCGARISVRYPLIELVTGGLFALTAWRFDLTIEGAAFAGLFWVLVVLTVVDIEHHLLPNAIVYPAFVAGWVVLAADALAAGDPGRLGDAGLGALVFGGFFFLIAFAYPAGMGGGDIKLGALLGTFLGYLDGLTVVVVAMFLAFALGAVGSVVLMLVRGAGRKTQVPFGPFLATAATIAVFVGRDVADAYLGSFG